MIGCRRVRFKHHAWSTKNSLERIPSNAAASNSADRTQLNSTPATPASKLLLHRIIVREALAPIGLRRVARRPVCLVHVDVVGAQSFETSLAVVSLGQISLPSGEVAYEMGGKNVSTGTACISTSTCVNVFKTERSEPSPIQTDQTANPPVHLDVTKHNNKYKTNFRWKRSRAQP